MNTHSAISELIAPWLELTDPKLAALVITHLELDSRLIKSGDTFVAIQGHAVDGRQFIDNAIAQGANVVLAEADAQHLNGWLSIVLVSPSSIWLNLVNICQSWLGVCMAATTIN